MKLHYFRSPHGNFGDDLNAWLWPELLPGAWDDGQDGITFVGIGTILNRLVPDTRLKIVAGSGVGYSPLPPNLHDGSWEILGLRGPLSARAAGLPAEAVITDGAILLGTIDGLVKPQGMRTGNVVFVPHVSSTETGAWEEICAELGITYIDPRWSFHEVFALIGNARLVLAEAMHGAIVADTLRVPFVPLVSSREISSFKWMDWTLSMGLPYRPIRLPPSSLLDAARDRLVTSMGHGHLNPGVFDTSADNSIADELLRQLGRASQREESPGWQRVHDNTKRLWRRVVKPATVKASGGMLAGLDRRLFDRATEAVRKAMDAPSYLSDDRTYESKRAQLMDRLEMTRRIAA
ncbi:MAG: polysaccharide pyruvyl transferase family protein [Pseudomonadota bacterium]|nr:polysaccharide pyruvyl transferase family protein [Pseudomonadota bacterium]